VKLQNSPAWAEGAANATTASAETAAAAVINLWIDFIVVFPCVKLTVARNVPPAAHLRVSAHFDNKKETE
jgi:hypothetical protein